MNILFVIGSYNNFGGTERVTTVLANAFEGNCSIAVFRGKCDPAKFNLSKNVKCFEIGNSPVASLRRIFIDEKIDIVINQWCLPFTTTRIINNARKGFEVRLISVLHGVPDRSKRIIVIEDEIKRTHGLARIIAHCKLWIMRFIIKASIRYVYRNSDAYVVLSDGFIPVFQQYAGLRNTPKLYAISNPLTINQGTQCVDLTRKKKQILYVGRMDKENKRVDRIIKAWEEVQSAYPDWELILVGDGPHLVELKSYVKNHDVKQVKFVGFVDEDPIKYYREASIFMLTSDLEGFGLVLVEAMSFGVVPLVYGSYVSVYDIITDYKDGLITSTPYSHREVCTKLKWLMENEALRHQMAECAFVKSEKFSLGTILGQWQKLFVALLPLQDSHV